ncbi:MAG: hypothetical protein AABY64_07985 [Bdellovibrionota bacterium]
MRPNQRTISYSIIAVTFVLGASVLAKFDNSELNDVKKKEKSSAAAVSKVDPKPNRARLDLTLKEDPKKLETQIKALNLIIKTESDRKKKIDLYLRKSYLHVSVAKMFGLNREKVNNITTPEKFHLDEAEKILNFLMKNIRNDKDVMGSIYNITGLVEYEKDQPAKAVEYFKKSIELNSKSPQSETMAIFIAEYYFDTDKYEEAIKYYRLLYKQMNPYQKALSDYKVAWCNINLRKYDVAEQGFTQIIKENLDKGVVDDSYKDLAFIITREKDENIVLERARTAFPQPQLRSKFLYNCLLFYLQQSKNNPRDSIFREIFSIQDDPHERSRLLALKVSFEKKDYPTVAVYKALTELNQHLANAEPKVRQKFFMGDAFQLEEDSEIIIRLFVDGYTGKVRTKENLPKPYLGKSMISLIAMHLNWFPHTKKYLPLYNLWIDACADLKDSACLLGLEKDLKAKQNERKEIAEAYRRVKLEVLSLYDSAYSADPVKHEGAFMFRLHEYVETYPIDPNTLRIQKRIFSIEFKNKKFKEALAWARKIWSSEQNAENLQKLWYTQFELGLYKEILESPDSAKFKSQELTDIRRETSLKSAQVNAAAGNFALYEADLKIYLGSNPSEEKSAVVYLDYFNRLLEQKKWEAISNEWNRLPEKIKTRNEFHGFRSRAFEQMTNQGVFVKIPGFWASTNDKDLNFQIFLNRRALSEKITSEEWKEIRNFPTARRNYIMNLLVLTRPIELNSWLLSQKNLSADEKKILYLSVLLEKKNSNFILTEKEMAPIKDLVPESRRPDAAAKIEKELNKLAFPTSAMKPARYNKMVEGLVGDIKVVRKRGFNSLNQLTRNQKRRVLAQLIMNETEMSKAIMNSPLPDGLTEAQITEYKGGLAELAKEYDLQAVEFTKAKSELEGQLLKENDPAMTLPEIQIEKWDLPAGAPKDMALNLFNKVSPAAALIYLDNQLGLKTVSPEDYSRIRGGLLLRISNSEAMRKLVHDEWVDAKQTVLIDKWREIKND